MEKLYQVTSPHFCAGVISRAGLISEAAPILYWMVGRTESFLVIYCQRKHWRVEIVSGTPLSPC